MGKKRRSDRYDEPALPGEGWYHYGPDSPWVAGETPAGLPYGPTRTEMLESLERDARGAGWARAKAILRSAFATCFPGTAVEIGRVTRLGRGLSRDAFVAYVEFLDDPEALSGPYAVFLPARGPVEGLDARTRREAQLLHRLFDLDLPFRVPSVVGTWPDAGHLALVRGWLEGVELDLRAGRQRRVRPWEVVGQIAAAVHSLDVSHFLDLLPGDDTRRAQAVRWLLELEDVDAPEAKAALAWARDHLPPDDPSVFVHGDLLGQNILLDPGHPPAVIDWEYSRRGDPAYDLAIVTRGVRRPFQMAGGMQRLLDAYARHGGQTIHVDHVRVYELGLAVKWYRDSLRSPRGKPPDQALALLRSLLRFLGA
jgi:aminoglycoside phosphotransferase (APT) family kinase protein